MLNLFRRSKRKVLDSDIAWVKKGAARYFIEIISALIDVIIVPLCLSVLQCTLQTFSKMVRVAFAVPMSTLPS